MYSFDSKVRYSECDENGRLSILSMVNYLQDCSTFHSESIGLGLEHMAREHYAWFISAWQIEICDLPRLATPIRISTWSYAMKRAQAHRNFTICAPDGTPYVRADSLWFVFDTELGCPVRIPQEQEAYLSDDPRLDMPEIQRKLPLEGDFTRCRPLVVSEQHLDTNRHVNNAQYIQMALDALEDMGEEPQPAKISVQYKSMALLGDSIEPRVHGKGSLRTVDLARTGSEESFAIVRIEGRLPHEAREVWA